MPQAGRRQRNTSRLSPQRSRIGIGNLNIVHHDHCIVGWILNHVERHIAEVALVGDAISSANRIAPVAEDVKGKADAWRHRAPGWVPQLVDRTRRRRKDLAAPHSLWDS